MQTKTLKANFTITTQMVNDFFLRIMEVSTATVDLKELTYGIVCGYMERMFSPEGKPIANETLSMIAYRKEKLKLMGEADDDDNKDRKSVV